MGQAHKIAIDCATNPLHKGRTMKTTTKTAAPDVTALKTALAEKRTAYHNRVATITMERVKQMLATLEADGWDAEKSFGYPMTQGSKATYLAKKEAYNFCRKFTKATYVSRMMHQPDSRVAKSEQEVEAIVEAIATKATEAYFDAWINKLAVKIGQPVITAQVQGDLWTHSFLTVTLENGETQKWKTKCIINCSVLGTLFNQFPTTLQK